MKQQNETPKAAAAFAAYCTMGPGRSLAKLAQKMRNNKANEEQKNGKHAPSVASLKRVLERWSSQHHWQERVRIYDQEQAEEARRQHNAAIEAMNERQAQIGYTQQKMMVSEIERQIEAGTLTAKDAIMLLKQGIEMERTARMALSTQASESKQASRKRKSQQTLVQVETYTPQS